MSQVVAAPVHTSRRALLFGAALGGTSAVAACANPGASPPSQATAGPLVTIEYYAGLNERQLGNYQKLLVEDFEKTHPSIKVMVNPSGGIDKMLPLLAAGTPPDVSSQARPREFLTKQIQEITSLVKRDKYDTTIFPKESFESTSTWRGKIISLPNEYGGTWPVMAYNRDMFRQAGVPEPPAKWGDPAWNAETYLQALQKLTRTDSDGKQITFGMNSPNMRMTVVFWPWLWRTSWITDDHKTIVSDSPQMVEAYEWLTGLTWKRRVVATDTMLRDAFGDPNGEKAMINGQVAMFSSAGSNRVIIVGQAVRDQKLPISYAPLPVFKNFRAAQHLNANGIVVGSKHPDQAFAYLKWAADTPNWGISRGNPPPRTEHFDTWAREVYGGIDAQIRIEVYRESLQYSSRRDPIEDLPTYEQMLADVFTPAFTKLYAGQADVGPTLREIKAPLQALVPKELG